MKTIESGECWILSKNESEQGEMPKKWDFIVVEKRFSRHTFHKLCWQSLLSVLKCVSQINVSFSHKYFLGNRIVVSINCRFRLWNCPKWLLIIIIIDEMNVYTIYLDLVADWMCRMCVKMLWLILWSVGIGSAIWICCVCTEFSVFPSFRSGYTRLAEEHTRAAIT